MKKYIRKYGFYLLCVVFLIAYFKLFCTAEVNGLSMYPTLNNEDFLLLRRTENIQRGDIVGIYSDTLQQVICKRIIGLPNDTVEIIGNQVTVNGVVIDEPYIVEEWDSYDKHLVPENCLYVLGDNRNDSTDSRMLGCISIDNMYGVLLFNITEMFGTTRHDMLIGLILIWILIFLFSISRKLFGRKDEV